MVTVAIHHPVRPETAAKADKPGLLRRLADAVMRARQKQVDSEMAQYVQRSGGRLTDEIERQMMQQLYGDWNFRA